MSNNVFLGKLSEHHLAEVLFKIHQRKVPGKISLLSKDVIRHLFIHDGQVIFAYSSRKADRLGEFLLEHNAISPAQFDHCCREIEKRRVRMGKVLLEIGAFDLETLGYYIKWQIKRILISSFGWDQGNIRFEPGEFKTDEVIKLNFDTPLAILEGVAALPSAERAEDHFCGGRTILRKRGGLQERFGDTMLPGECTQLYEAVGGKRNVNELVDLFPDYPRHYVLNLLHALNYLGVIESAHEPVRIVVKKAPGRS